MRLISSIVLVLLSGCLMSNVSASTRLKDAVIGLNDEIRWSRIDLAIQRVHPDYKQEYTLTHHAWGGNIQIADMELLNVQLGEEMDAAMSIVSVSWYRYDTMTLHQTVVRQQWALVGRAYVLERERVLGGDPALLAPPEEPAAEEVTASDDDALAYVD